MTQIMTTILNKIAKLERLESNEIRILKTLYTRFDVPEYYRTIILLCIKYGCSKNKTEMIFGYDKINTALLLMKKGEYYKISF